MLQSIVGPPLVGATDLRSPPGKSVDSDLKSSRQDSFFGKTLEDKMSSKSAKTETKESPQKELRQKEDPPQASKGKAEQTVGKPQNKKGTGRQQAIKEFMDSFESEFEISPTRLVEAMAQLDENKLTQSPEDTADAVIDLLGLDDTQAEKAQAMYSALLMQLSQMPQQQQPKPVPEMGMGSGVSQEHIQARIAAAQGRQDALSASVDNLNKKFWMTRQEKAVPTAVPTMDGSLAQRLMMEDSLPQQNPLEAPEMEMSEAAPEALQVSLDQLPPHLQGQMKEAMSPALLAALAAKKAQTETVSEDSADLMNEFQQVAQDVNSPQDGLKAEATVQGKAAQEFFQNQSRGESLMQQNSQEFAKSANKGEKELSPKVTEKSLGFKQSLSGLESIHGAPIKGESLQLTPTPVIGAATPGAAPTQAEHEAAVKQIMNQAQYLIKKGGGEMKVQMTPEGMGTIHLKVMLQDGKVNLQMSADTQEAKKTIESSLAELKTSLAAHKLSMENVKVDVVNSTSTDTATQNQTNLNGQNQRDQSRQFWNQFNENFGSQGRREAYAELPNLRGYGNRDRNPLQPIEASSTPRTRNVEGKGSGLNLVA